MKIINKLGTSIIEAMIVLMVITSGIVGVYKIYSESNSFSNSLEHRITAIQIAKEGIEAFKNIRDTNQLIFSADYTNCWNTLNYDDSCIGNTTVDHRMRGFGYLPAGSTIKRLYIIYQDNQDKWILGDINIDETKIKYSDSDYRNLFKVGVDSNGFYTQTGAMVDTKPLFTRQLRIDPIDTDGGVPDNMIDDEKMRIKSLVQWVTDGVLHEIELETIVSNWKNNK